jgi:flagellar protein FliO/FliZ
MTVRRCTVPAFTAAAAAGVLACAAPIAPAAARVATHAHSRASFPAEQTALKFGSSTASKHAATGGGSSIVRTIVGLLIVVALIYAAYWVLRRVRKARDGRVSGSGLATVAMLPLGGGRSLHLVRAGADLILVGSSEHGVTPIRSYGPDEAQASGLLGDAPPAPERIAAQAPAEWRPAADWQELPRRSAGAPPGGLIETLRRLTVRS